MKKKNSFLLLLLLSCILLNACKKNFSDEQYTPGNTTKLPDLTSTITASVSGFITDQNGAAVSGAQVTGGTQSAITNQYGYFKLNNISLGKTAGFVKVSMAGYFNGYRTFSANQGKETFIRLQLIPKTTIGTINAITGGSASTSDGGIVTLPANGVVVASNSVAYTGTVHIAAYWINPSADNLQAIMPGNLVGIDTAGYLKTLTTYGMLAVELTDDAGNLLQIATGKQATLSFPIPSSLTASAPASIALWSFNETNGLWKQEDSAIKTGSNYVGNVSHFSYWNCDIGRALVNFTTQIVDSALNPLENVAVLLSLEGSNTSSRVAFTDNQGFVYGKIPANSILVMSVLSDCNIATFTKDFTTAGNDIDLGTIATNNTQNEFVITGSVIDCNNMLVINGSVIIYGNNFGKIAPLKNGLFTLNTLGCGNTLSVTAIVIDTNNNPQGALQNFTLRTGNNNLGALSMCNNLSSDEYLTLSVDGGTPVTASPGSTRFSSKVSYTSGDSLTIINRTFGDSLVSSANSGIAILLYHLAGTGDFPVFSRQPLDSFEVQNGTLGLFKNPDPFITTITEFGNVNQYISGYFTSTFHSYNRNPEDHVISCAFRVKRIE